MKAYPSLFEALEQADLADDIEKALPALVSHVLQGKVSVEDPGNMAVERVLFDHSALTIERFEMFKPLLDALVTRGHSVWYSPDGNRRGLYGFLCEDTLGCQHILEWMWSQADAPARQEPTVGQQIRRDQLKALLSSNSMEFSCAHLIKNTGGFPLDERWADGKTTFSHVVDMLLDKLPVKRKDFEWCNDLRLCRRLFKAVSDRLPSEESLEIVVPAALVAGRAWASHQSVTRLVGADEKRPDWMGPWQELLKDIAPANGAKRGHVADGWNVFVRWARDISPSVPAIGAIAAGTEVMAGNFPEFKTEQARRKAVDDVVKALETLGIEQLLASDEALTRHYPLTSPLWRDFTGTIDQCVDWRPSEVWKILLPAQLVCGTQTNPNQPCLGYSPTIAKSLERWLPKGEGFQWPTNRFWNQVVAHWGWTSDLQALARARTMDEVLPETFAVAKRPRM